MILADFCLRTQRQGITLNVSRTLGVLDYSTLLSALESTSEKLPAFAAMLLETLKYKQAILSIKYVCVCAYVYLYVKSLE